MTVRDTLRRQLFAGTIFCDFGLKHLLQVLNFAIQVYMEMVQGRQTPMFYTITVVHIAMI